MAQRVTSRSKKAASALRAEARILTIAGMLLLAIGLPVTLTLVMLALAGAVTPPTPIAAGAPPILLGYLACHFASARMARANTLAPLPRTRSKRPPPLAAASRNC
jgi:hypothetical protein